MENNSRRKFLGLCLGGITATAAAAVSYPVYRYLAPRPVSDSFRKVVIAEKDLAEGEARFVEFDGSSAVVVRTKKGEFFALSAVCTHLGCIVRWEKEQQVFVCPCHGGKYSAEGNVISGPPPKPLAKLPVSAAGGNITIG